MQVSLLGVAIWVLAHSQPRRGRVRDQPDEMQALGWRAEGTQCWCVLRRDLAWAMERDPQLCR